MDLHQLNYMFQHRALPHFFYTQKEAFVKLAVLCDGGELIFQLHRGLFEQEETPCPYTAEQYDAQTLTVGEGVRALKLTFPEPENTPLCYYSLLFYNDDFTHLLYFTVEKSLALFGDDRPVLCAWTPDGTHCNYGSCDVENGEDLKKCAEIFNA